MKKRDLKSFEADKRNLMVGIKLNKKEFDEVTRLCKKLDITKSKYFRYLHTKNIAENV